MLRRTILFATALSAVALPASAASAATIQIVDGTAVFSAEAGERNDVRAGGIAAPDERTLKVIDTGAPLTAGPGCQRIDDNSAWCPEAADAPLPLAIATRDGDDRVTVNDFAERDVTVLGGSGDDVLHVGSGGTISPTLDGGPGDDRLSTSVNGDGAPILRGGGGDDELTIGELGGGSALGGPGADRILFAALPLQAPVRLDGGGGPDTYTFGVQLFLPEAVVSGPGVDTLDQSDIPAPLDLDLVRCPGCFDRVIGTALADRIVGDGASQVILAGDGNDAVDGGGGLDDLSGQDGDDTVVSRDLATDVVRCGDGSDTVLADRRDRVARSCESVTRGL